MKSCNEARMCNRSLIAVMVGVVLLVAGATKAQVVQAKDLRLPQAQEETAYESIEGAFSFDEQQKGIPKSIFVSIEMAKGYEEEWDSFGRQGWYTQDPRFVPVEPNTTTFPRNADAVYIVFEVAPQEDPITFGAQWFLVDRQGQKTSEEPVGQDALALPGHSRSGFLQLLKPDSGWTPGQYMAEIFITPRGQQPFHAVNKVGSMNFTITDQVIPTAGHTRSPKAGPGKERVPDDKERGEEADDFEPYREPSSIY